MASTQLPTVDLSACYFGGIDEVAKQLKEAFRDFGCAYLMNHGIPQQQVRGWNEAINFRGGLVTP